ncbi:hypothetical protein GI482_13105 [Bacillus sp. N3536]|nr:hypothetical protein GI482_13105 [Bacillus sp. N3536]
MQKWKKTGVAVLVATLTVSGAGYAWASGNYDTVSINDVYKNTNESTEATQTTTTPETTKAATESTTTTATPATNLDIPVEVSTEKLVGLMKAYENAGSTEAKAAILNVINRVIAEYETTQKDIYKEKAPELTAAIDRLIVLFKTYQQAPSADTKAAIITQVKAVITELQNYLNKQEEPKEDKPVIVPPVNDKPNKDKDKAEKEKKKAELEKKKAEEKAAKEAAKAEAEAKRAAEKAAKEAKREAEKAAKQAEIEAAKKAKAAEIAAKKALQEQKVADKKAEKQHKHPHGKDDKQHNHGPNHNQNNNHDKHNKHDHNNNQHNDKNDRN